MMIEAARAAPQSAEELLPDLRRMLRRTFMVEDRIAKRRTLPRQWRLGREAVVRKAWEDARKERQRLDVVGMRARLNRHAEAQTARLKAAFVPPSGGGGEEVNSRHCEPCSADEA